VIAWLVVCRYTDGMAFEWGWFRQERGWRRRTMRRRAVVEGPGRRPCGGEGRPRCLGHQLGHGRSNPGTWAASTRTSSMGPGGSKPSGGVDVGQVLEKARAWKVGHVAHRPGSSTSAKSWRRPGRGRSDTWRPEEGLVVSLKNHHRRRVSRFHQKPWVSQFSQNCALAARGVGVRGVIAKVASRRS
jgi:hypothetical protein